MADTSLLEVARQTHEEVERYQQALVDILISSSSSSTSAITHKEKLKRAHKASDLLDRITSRYQFLDQFYVDADGERARELDSLASSHASSSKTSTNNGDDQLFGEFYDRLNRVTEYHERYPGALPDTFSVEFSALESGGGASSNGLGSSAAAAAEYDAAGLDFIDRMFSGEEMAGRFLDLYVHHEAYLNLKGVRRNTYLQYIDDFDKLTGPNATIPNDTKRSEAYRNYLLNLHAYLSGFLRKTQPLANVDQVEETALSTFEQQWEQGTLPGWEGKGEEVFGNIKGRHGPAGAKDDSQGIWCAACKRYYSKQTVYDAHLKSPKHLKAADRLAKSEDSASKDQRSQETSAAQNENERAKHRAKAKLIARQEALIMALGTELQSLRADTKTNVERRAALTDRERQAEAEAAEAELNRMTALGGTSGLDSDAQMANGEGNVDDDDDGTSKVYNPLKLPLGWDGRPIPYWLYKLHGLGQDFKCEICSDFVYQGRKNFEKHFQESRHAFGMRALGLPNTVQFRDVTKIADALALADKLRRQGKLQSENTADAEEVEDEHGNTYTRKTYELLKRQGLL